MISSYSLSVLYLDGVKYGDVQMTAMGMLMTVAFTTVSRSKPLDKLSSVQPLTSIFHPSSFISLLGQFCVHFFIMMIAVHTAKEHLPPDYEPDSRRSLRVLCRGDPILASGHGARGSVSERPRRPGYDDAGSRSGVPLAEWIRHAVRRREYRR